ncbi:MAG: M67 family metallopeptidase [Candidatus Omnitrophica bacterium]|nr:M67 family metallopeptidase [Candidatus Omnitrophota bacterium]
MLKIKSSILQKMIQYCEKEKQEAGNEACGYLVGRDGVVTEAYLVENAHRSPTSYHMQPVAQLVLQKTLRELKLEEMAIYHSHVATQAYPSRRDIDNATAVQDLFDGHYVLVSLQEPGRPIVKAFKIRDGNVQEEEIQEVSPEGRHPRGSEDQRREDSRFRGND